MAKEDQMRFNQRTLGIDDTIIRIDKKRIGDVITDIQNDDRLSNVSLKPDYPNATRYEIRQEGLTLVTIVGDRESYLASFGVIPQRDYPANSEERKRLGPMVQALKEIFTKYKA